MSETPYNSTGTNAYGQKESKIAKFCEDESAMLPTPIIVSPKISFMMIKENLRMIFVTWKMDFC